MLEALSQASRANENLLVAVIAECRLAAIKLQFGDLPRAKAQFEGALALAKGNRRLPLPVACEAMMGLGKIFWEWGEMQPAQQWLEDGFGLSKRWRAATALEGTIILALMHQAGGEVDIAAEWLAQAQNLAQQHTATKTDNRYVEAQRAQLAIMGGDWESAERWGSAQGLDHYLRKSTLDPDQSLGASIILRYELIIYARLLIARERYRDALGILDLILPDLMAGEHRLKTIEICLLRSICFMELGNKDASILAFKTALQLAEPGRYLRVFVDEGQRVSRLLEVYHTQGQASDYSRRLLAHLVPETPAPELPDWVDPLSQREIEVLRRLASDRTVPEIAEALFITVSTLRTHVRNIYAKLGVHSRFEAVAKGRELNLT